MKHIYWNIGHDLIIDNIVRGENCYLYDIDDKKYIDFESGIWCLGLGHCNPRINKIIKNQIERISHTGYCYADGIIEQSAQNILETLNFIDGKCVFLCSGSEAIEYSVRIAQTVSDRPLLLAMNDSYFGAYGTAYKKSENEWYFFDWLKCSDCPHIENCNPECERIKEIPFNKISAFLFEPGSSSGLVRFPPFKIIENIVQKVKEQNGLIIVNEVTTGLGRTGKWYGFIHYDMQPDIVALGKGLGNGYPVSVSAFNNKINEKLKNKEFKYSQSHQNDPLGAAIANEVILIIKELNLIERCKRIANNFIGRLKKIQKEYKEIKEIRGRGLMIVIEFNDNVNGSLIQTIFTDLLNTGIIISKRPGLNIFRIDPPLTIGEKDIDTFLNSFENILKKLINKIK